MPFESEDEPKVQLPPMKVYSILSDAVEQGIHRGLYRAHKHTDTPSLEAIHEAIHAAVMGEIVEIFDFDDD